MSKTMVSCSEQPVFGPWRKQEKMNIGSMLLPWMSRRVGPHWPFQALSGSRFGNQECVKEACQACPHLFPCPTSWASQGQGPHPDRSRLAPGAEVAKTLDRPRCLISEAFGASRVEGSQGGSSW